MFSNSRALIPTALLAAALAWLAQGTAWSAVDLASALDGPGLLWQSGGATPWTGQTLLTHDGLDAAQSGAITNTQDSWLETTVAGPGTLRFWWKVSSELGYDQLQFLIDDVERINISGEIDWEERSFEIAAGNHTLRWRYAKDTSDSAGQDRAWLDQAGFTPAGDMAPFIVTPPSSQTVATGMVVQFNVTATGIPPPAYRWYFNNALIANATGSTLNLGSVTTNQAGRYTVAVSNYLNSITSAPAVLTVTELGPALESGDVAWHVGGQGSWFAQNQVTHDGVDAAESGAITNLQQCWVECSVVGPGVLSFWWRASSEPGYDGLQFMTNDTVIASLSGETQWEQRSLRVPQGSHVLRWRYFKDASISQGLDKGWLDEAQFVPSTPPTGLSLAWSAAPIQENNSANLYGSFIDPNVTDPHMVIVNWGDGTPPSTNMLAPGVVTYFASHAYPDDDPSGTSMDTYTIRTTVSDETGATAADLPLQVVNVAPQLQNLFLTPTILPYETVTLSGTLADQGPRDTLRLEINWGDGTPVESVNYASNFAAFNLRHRYTLSSTNPPVLITARDDDDGRLTILTNVAIGPLPAQPRVSLLAPMSPTRARLGLQGSPGINYQVQASHNLKQWVTIAIRTADASGAVTIEDLERPQHRTRFYRGLWTSQTPGASFLRVLGMTNGHLRMLVTGFPGLTYRIETSTNFIQWTSWISKKTDTNGFGEFEDSSPAPPRRLYRAVWP